MGYISELRKFVGHAPIIHTCASVIVEQNGKILLQKRRDNGLWCYAGGSVELYESTENAAKRELYEECGITALSLELFGVFSGEDFAYTYPNGDMVSTIDIVYTCREFEGELRPQPEEVTELKFFPPDDLPPLCEPVKPVISKYLSLLKM